LATAALRGGPGEEGGVEADGRRDTGFDESRCEREGWGGSDTRVGGSGPDEVEFVRASRRSKGANPREVDRARCGMAETRFEAALPIADDLASESSERSRAEARLGPLVATTGLVDGCDDVDNGAADITAAEGLDQGRALRFQASKPA
jgi:hypothetical protein